MPQRYFLFFLVVCTAHFFEVKSINIVKSLALLLDNIKYSHNLSVDISFGVNIAYKLLSGNNPIFQLKSDRNSFYWKTLECLKVLKNSGQSQNVSVYGEILLESISKTSEIWRRPIKYQQLTKSIKTGSFFNYERVVDKGFPKKIDSDKCIAQLGSTKSCAISSKCLAMMTSNTPSYGYHKTHKVLFLLIVLLKGCLHHLPIDHSIDVIVGKQCSDILIEHYTLRRYDVPKEFHDLFMEQALLCGIAGHSEFLSSSTINPVVQWQSSDGCFETNLEPTDSSCMSHINSLAITFYSHLITRAIKIF